MPQKWRRALRELSSSSVFRLWPYAKPYNHYLIIGLSSTVITYLAQALPPLFFGWLIDQGLRGHNWGRTLELITWTAASFAVYLVFDYLETLWMESWAQKVEHSVRVDAYDKAQRLKLSYFDEHQTGELISILSNDINQLERLLDTNMQRTLQVFIQLGTMTAVMLYLNWQLTVLLLLPLPFMAYATIRYTGLIKDKYRQIRSAVGRLNSHLTETLRNIGVVKAFVREDYERERVRDASMEYHDDNVQAITMRAVFFPALESVSYLAYVVVLLIGSWGIMQGWFAIGTLTTFIIYVQRFFGPMNRFGRMVNDFQRAAASTDRIFYVLDHPDVEPQDSGLPRLEAVRGHIVFDHVTFRYPGYEYPVIDDLSVEIPAGGSLGIAGPTGSGKSTFTKLLLRYYQVTEGRILIDGQDIGELDMHSLRDKIGLVPQETELFFGTVRENLQYGNPEASFEDIQQAAEAAGATEFIDELPQQYDTRIGEKGVKLSGGQRQRIAIARALLKDPQVIVLDEATSAVDNETERRIQQALDRLCAGRSSIIIAHRLSTLVKADQIVVMDRGKVVEKGTHSQLLKRGGLYARLWWAQREAEEELETGPAAAGSS